MNNQKDHELLPNIGAILPIFGAITLVLSTLYETCFYLGLDFNITIIPVSFTDVINTSISWLPRVALIAAIMSFIHALTNLFTSFANNKYFIFFMIFLLLIIPITYFFQNSVIVKFNYFVEVYTVLLVLFSTGLLAVISWYIFRIRIIKYSFYDLVYTFSSLIIILTMIVGYQSGKSIIELPIRRDVITLDGGEIINNIRVIRNYQSGTLVINLEGIITFYDRETIRKISTPGREALWRLEGG